MNVLILGSKGRTGSSFIRFLERKGRAYSVFNDCDFANNSYNDQQNYRDLLSGCDLVLQSPGIPYDHPIRMLALSNNIPVKTDLDIFFEENPNAKVIAITGTNGKSTIASIVHHSLGRLGIKSVLGGNIGNPILDISSANLSSINPVNDLSCDVYYVFELSSYQLHLSNSYPYVVSAINNISSSHLKWHKTFDHYKNSKLKIYEKSYKHIDSFSDVIDKINMDDYPFLFGDHNRENLAVSFKILSSIVDHNMSNDIDDKKVLEAMHSFKGLEHRQEIFLKKNRSLLENKIFFVNDSKSTNFYATIKAIEAFSDRKIFLMLGGERNRFDKTLPDRIMPYKDCIKNIYLFGDAKEGLLSDFKGKILTKDFKNLNKACICACEDILNDNIFSDSNNDSNNDSKNDKVNNSIGGSALLFSPGHPSFDAFDNFEKRGEFFKKIILNFVTTRS